MAPEPRNENGRHDEITPTTESSRDMMEKEIRASARTEAKVEALTETIKELKKTIEETVRDLRKTMEEVIDRVDADVDSIRAKTEPVAVIGAALDDIKRRLTVLETKVESNVVDIAKLETKLDGAIIDKTKLETRLEGVQAKVLVASGAFAVLAWLASRIFHG